MKYKIFIFLLSLIRYTLVSSGSTIYSENDYEINDTKSNSSKRNSDTLKVALCAIGKDENLYVREWVEYYKKLGLEKIILYDNNDLDGEKFNEVINDYIESEFVEVIDRRGVVKTIKDETNGMSVQGLAYRDCYYNNYKKYDWLFFFDLDEFLCIDFKYKDIFEFLNDFNKYDGIKVQWRDYGDNGYLHYENKPVIERFKHENNFKFDKFVKTILKCKEYDFDVLFNAHTVLSDVPVIVNLNKKRVTISENSYYSDYTSSEPYDNLPVYLDHFLTKSTDEFIKRKYKKGTPDHGNYKESWRNSLSKVKNDYFYYNKFTKEKEKIFDELKKKRKLKRKRNKKRKVYKSKRSRNGKRKANMKNII